ncbi:hypothetical protein B0H16DRAFT_1830572 [Mycena metata]|uniref:Uncharacterized protein n=1 Tax=Mycena metata TaxID=1033252 RepID=A0AAD7K7T8_9AGAR|nr:hypothetical protein B0H16DRAFT_1830572 [Mycena metata]
MYNDHLPQGPASFLPFPLPPSDRPHSNTTFFTLPREFTMDGTLPPIQLSNFRRLQPYFGVAPAVQRGRPPLGTPQTGSRGAPVGRSVPPVMKTYPTPATYSTVQSPSGLHPASARLSSVIPPTSRANRGHGGPEHSFGPRLQMLQESIDHAVRLQSSQNQEIIRRLAILEAAALGGNSVHSSTIALIGVPPDAHPLAMEGHVHDLAECAYSGPPDLMIDDHPSAHIHTVENTQPFCLGDGTARVRRGANDGDGCVTFTSISALANAPVELEVEDTVSSSHPQTSLSISALASVPMELEVVDTNDPQNSPLTPALSLVPMSLRLSPPIIISTTLPVCKNHQKPQ